ncbi:MAG: 50S ribosomal protein L1 [Candidatus Omnitrophota bacterium]
MSKRKKEIDKLVDKSKKYGLKEALSILKQVPRAKFDETVELNFRMDVDPKQSSQVIRGTVALPHGTGKSVRVAVFCKGEAETRAKEAGADFVGSSDLVDKVSKGWSEFDVAIATPDMMRDIGRLGKVLGPKGLMPSPKAGTVTPDVEKAVKEVKAGRIEYRMDKQSNIQVPMGKVSFDEKALYENGKSLIEAVMGSRPVGLKGNYIKSIAISTTMGPGLKLELSNIIG